MEGFINNFGNYSFQDEESQNNGIKKDQEDIQNNIFQFDFVKYSYPLTPYNQYPNQNLSLIDGEKLDFSPYPEENDVDQNTIIPNITKNQKTDAAFNGMKKIQIIAHTKTTTFITKKKGRKNIKSNEKGEHTKYFPDNRRESYWRLFMNYILMLANSFSSPYNMKPTNFIQQYGGNSIADNEKFLKVKIYQYFSYNTSFNDEKIHRKIGDRNLEIIKKMISKNKNPTYIAIMKSSIEEMFEIFKNNKKYIIKDGKLYYLSDFKTIDDAYIEIQNNLKKDNVLSDEEIKDELYRLETLVDYIKIKGKEIKRKIESTKEIDYITINELEDN